VKCRIGVDEQDPEDALPRFLEAVAGAGVRRVTVHARKAWLQGLSPKENREVPPLDYGLVLRMKERFPELHLSINGGVQGLDAVQELLPQGLDGVMVGRAAYHQPWDVLGDADRRVFGVENPVGTPEEGARAMVPYIEAHLADGGRLHQVTRHMLGLFAGRPGARPGGAFCRGGEPTGGGGAHAGAGACVRRGRADRCVICIDVTASLPGRWVRIAA
jgi:tRNA-dihydrouridine synthase A